MVYPGNNSRKHCEGLGSKYSRKVSRRAVSLRGKEMRVFILEHSSLIGWGLLLGSKSPLAYSACWPSTNAPRRRPRSWLWGTLHRGNGPSTAYFLSFHTQSLLPFSFSSYQEPLTVFKTRAEIFGNKSWVERVQFLNT